MRPISSFSVSAAIVLAMLTIAGCTAPQQMPLVDESGQAGMMYEASLALSPASGTIRVGESVTADVVLTSATALSAVDVVVGFDPELMSVTDANSDAAGTQIETTRVFEQYPLNEVVDGQIMLGAGSLQAVPAGTHVIARVSFTATRAGTANVTFDFENGSTTDSDVFTDIGTEDALARVTGATFTITE